MGKIVLGSAIQLTYPTYTNEVHDGIISVEPDVMRIRANWYWQEYVEVPAPTTADPLATTTVASGDPILKREDGIVITGSEWTQIKQTEIKANHVGQKFFTLLRKFARGKLQEKLNLTGEDYD